MSTLLEFWKQQLEMHQYTVTELERMWHETHNELNDIDNDYADIADMPEYVIKERDRILNEMRDYRTAIRRNKALIEKCKLQIVAIEKA